MLATMQGTAGICIEGGWQQIHVMATVSLCALLMQAVLTKQAVCITSAVYLLLYERV